ncbi:hypothetical protein ACEPAF_8641 [Sanghuangporus sanghuang]
MSYYNVDYGTSTYDYSYAYGSSQGEYPPTYAANYPADQIPKGGYSDAYGRTAAAFDNHNDTSRAGPSTFGGLANGTTNNAGKGPSMTFRGVPFFRPPAHGSETSALTEDGLGYVGYAHAELGQVRDVSSPWGTSFASSSSGNSVRLRSEQTDPPVPHASRSHVQPSTFDSFISPGSSTHGSSEGEEPTPDTGVFNYSANGVLNRGYPIARRDRAEGYYTSASSSVGINTVGGLVNVTANGTQFGGPLTLAEHPPLHVINTPDFEEHKLGYAPFNPTRVDSHGPIGSAEEVSSSCSDLDYSAFSDNLGLAQHEKTAGGAEMCFGVERTNSSPSINQGIDASSYHAQGRYGLGFTEQSGSMDFISNVGSGLPKEPAFMSAPRTRFKSIENSTYASTGFGIQTAAPTGMLRFNSSDSTGHYSLSLQSTMPLPGINGKPLPDTSLDSCRDLQSVNHNKHQEAQYGQGPVNVARLNRGATAFVPDMSHTQAAAAAYAATPTNSTPSRSGPSQSHAESAEGTTVGKRKATSSASRKMKGTEKNKRSGSHLRQKPYNVGRSALTSKYECSHGCKTWCRSKKELKRHEFRHERPDSYGWLCPGLGFPWAEHGSKACSCPTLGYTRSDDLVRHLKQRGPGNPCYEIALGLNWSPGIRGSIKNLPERYRPT